MSLPLPSPDALEHSQKLVAYLQARCLDQSGWLSFAEFMDQTLYAPGLGYYTAGASKFGVSGDFVTAPEISPLFAAALARQIAPLLQASAPHVIEVGAGSGRLAADLLIELAELGHLPQTYGILELSPDLRQRQEMLLRTKAPELAKRVYWLDTLPEHFAGVVLGNELIDAMPVHLVRWPGVGELAEEVGVCWSADTCGWVWESRPAQGALLAAAQSISQEAEERDEPLPPGYQSEINLAARAWVASWGNILSQGALLLIDYGFPAHEFYHPQRSTGSLMCHYRHYAHTDPLYLPGLQDITAHVDFTALIAAGFDNGLELLGYTSQGQFLLNCGLLDCLESRIRGKGKGDYGAPESIALSAGVNRLVLPQEMGELFKVMVLGKNIGIPLQGFAQGDRSFQL